MKTQVIQLESYDDATSTCDKMSWVKVPRILLVLPEHGRILERRLDLVLVQRCAQKMGAQVALVTDRETVRFNAAQLRIPVFYSIETAQRKPWKRPSKRRILSEPLRLKITPGELRDQGDGYHRLKEMSLVVRLALFSLGILAVLAMIFLFLPEAHISLAMAEQNQEISFALKAGEGFQTTNISGLIPVEVLSTTVEGQKIAESTSRLPIPEENASGWVEFSNLGETSVIVPEGAIVLTTGSTPIRFATDQIGTVPAGLGKTVKISIKAVSPGKSGNVAAGQIVAIEGSTGLAVTVTNPEPTQGGMDRVSLAPSKSDYDHLREALIEELTQTAIKELKSGIAAEQIIIPASVKVKTILSEEDKPEIGQPGDQLRMTLRVEFSAWSISKSDVEHLAASILDANLPEGTNAVPNTLVTEMVGDPIMEKDTIHWGVQARRTIRSEVFQEQLAVALVGKPSKEAGMVLSQQLKLREVPVISIFPSWWPRLPYLPFRIHMVVR